MLIAWAVSCDSYELRDDGTANIFGAGFDTFFVPSIPVELDFTILVRLLLMEGDKDEIGMQILGSETQLLGDLSIEIEADPGPHHRAGYVVSQIEVLEVPSITAEAEGVYSVEIYLGSHRPGPSEDRRRSIFFNVLEGEPNL